MIESERSAEAVRKEAKAALTAADPRTPTKDSDYVFITFILSHFPHGAVGLLIAVMFSAALSSKASELNALATTTTIDFWRRFRPLAAAAHPGSDPARSYRPWIAGRSGWNCRGPDLFVLRDHAAELADGCLGRGDRCLSVCVCERGDRFRLLPGVEGLPARSYRGVAL